MASGRSQLGHWQFVNLGEFHRGVSQKALVFWRHFAGAVLKLPRGVCQNRRELP
jgi:hypothetical protein